MPATADETVVKRADDDDDMSEYTRLIADTHPSGDGNSPTPLSPPQPSIAVFRRRWYVLAVFSVVSFTQNTLWNTWAPLSGSVQVAYGWDSSIVAWLTACGAIAFLLSAHFVSWLMDTRGLRWACLYTTAALLVGTAVRCIPAAPRESLHIG